MDCAVAQLGSGRAHPLTHELVPLHSAERGLTEIPPPSEPQPSCSGASIGFRTTDNIKSEPDSTSDSESYSDSNCYNTGYNSDDSHLKDFDEDYVSDIFATDSKKYNYLDPNFFPELYKS